MRLQGFQNENENTDSKYKDVRTERYDQLACWAMENTVGTKDGSSGIRGGHMWILLMLLLSVIFWRVGTAVRSRQQRRQQQPVLTKEQATEETAAAGYIGIRYCG